ncbi:MAG: hypothetical protein DVB23_003365 [Verrucomicrobia bacterium]|nr:MAG: hypothetical protein DVB23_003365 [Verrucomicrobiota bacterium]
MNSKSILRIVACLTALFLLGGVCGYATSGRLDPRPSYPRSTQWAERWMEQRMVEDFQRIGATPEQQDELRPIYGRLLAEFNAIQEESAQKVSDSFKRHGRDVWMKLTPEQREEFQKVNQERRNRAPKSSANSQ